MQKLDNLWLGVFIGILTTIIGFLMVYAWAHYMQSNALTLKDLWNYKLAAVPFIQLGALLNIGPFYLFLNKNYYYTAKGIVVAGLVFFVLSLSISLF